MTETKNHTSPGHPDKLRVEFTAGQHPKLYFNKLCQEPVKIERSVNNDPWGTIAEGVRSPYTDQDYPSDSTQLRYRILFGEPEQQSYELTVNRPE